MCNALQSRTCIVLYKTDMLFDTFVSTIFICSLRVFINSYSKECFMCYLLNVCSIKNYMHICSTLFFCC